MHMRSVQIPGFRLRHWLMGLAVVLGAVSILPSSSCAQARFPGAPDEPSANLRIYPLNTWSPRIGVGVGAGLVVHHLGRRHAQALLTAAPSRHEQAATLAWASANPTRARRYLLMDARGLHTNRDWFYGLGPRSSMDARQSIERSALQVRARAGQHFLNRRLLVQPHLGVTAHRVDRVSVPSAPRLRPRSRRHLRQLASPQVGSLAPNQTGVRIGVDLQYDTSPSPDRPRKGVRLVTGWTRYVAVSSSFLHYDRLSFGAYGTLPVRKSVLQARLSLVQTLARGRAAVPYYLRPTLGGSLVPGWSRHRFVDSDRLLGSLLYRFPLAQPFSLLRLEGHVGLHAGSVYEDVFSDAALALTFDESIDSGGRRVPLRPAASIGLHVGLSFRQTPSMDLALGVSPEGVTVVRFSLTQDLQALRRPHHQIRP